MAKLLFDGKKEAERQATFLEETERVLGKSLVIFQCDGRAEESSYVRLKREMGERLGAMVTVEFVPTKDRLIEKILEANQDETLDGILVQLPVVGVAKAELHEVLSLIDPDKDVDGLNPESRFLPAAVRAVERLVDIFKVAKDDRLVVVGSAGMVGSRLLVRLRELGYEVMGFDKGDDLGRLSEFDVVVSATGAKGLITGEMVKAGFVGIDLGFPRADFSEEAIEKASIVTPVPGGVGPMTIVALYENLAEV